MPATVGVDLGGTKMLAVRLVGSTVADEALANAPTEQGRLVEGIVAAVRSVWDGEVRAVGVGVAGLVRHPEGEFRWGPHVSGVRIPLRAALQEALGVPCAVDNDANAGALGEMRAGTGAGHDNVLFVTIGTGIGGAHVLDGEVRRGASFAGEYGHVTLVEGGGPCECGRFGCWETVASGPALARLASDVPEWPVRAGASRPVTAEEVVDAAAAGDPVAVGLMSEIGRRFGEGLAGLIAILDPELVVVGGGLGCAGGAIIDEARAVVAERLHGRPHREPPPIVVAGLGERAGAVGAALLAADLVVAGTDRARGAEDE